MPPYIMSKEKRYSEAAKRGEEALEIRRHVLAPEHPLTLRSMSNLADSLSKLGRWSEAEALLTQALAIQRRILRRDCPDTALSTYNLACVLAHEGKRVQALAMLREAVDHGLATWIDLEIDKDPDLICSTATRISSFLSVMPEPKPPDKQPPTRVSATPPDGVRRKRRAACAFFLIGRLGSAVVTVPKLIGMRRDGISQRNANRAEVRGSGCDMQSALQLA